mmetsp:Transcript_30596/g.63215  ORF Transcript_30596/g.63215 Transcript_30596/m.63215 type:complete len:272 (+) Transcript_30596:167-982(+)
MAAFLSANIAARSSSFCLASARSSSNLSLINRASSCFKRSSSSFRSFSSFTCSCSVLNISDRSSTSRFLSFSSLCSAFRTSSSKRLCHITSSSLFRCFSSAFSSSALSRATIHSRSSCCPSCSLNASQLSLNCRSRIWLANSLFSCSRRRTNSLALAFKRSRRMSGVSSNASNSIVYAASSSASIAASRALLASKSLSRSLAIESTRREAALRSILEEVFCSHWATRWSEVSLLNLSSYTLRCSSSFLRCMIMKSGANLPELFFVAILRFY